jgi:hypothetical protein
MGNGYSKMLQMIQVDENEKKKEGNNINMTKTEYLNGFDTSADSSEKVPLIYCGIDFIAEYIIKRKINAE